MNILILWFIILACAYMKEQGMAKDWNNASTALQLFCIFKMAMELLIVILKVIDFFNI